MVDEKGVGVELLTESRIAAVENPENLAVAIMIARQRAQCEGAGCEFAYVNYALGQSPFPVPEPVRAALRAAAEHGEYLPAVGIPALRDQVSVFWRERFGLDVSPDRVVITPGSKQAIFTILAMLQGPLLLPSASWVGTLPIARILGKDVRIVPTRAADGYRLTANGLREVVDSMDTRQCILMLNSPHNPTGAVYSRAELTEIAGVCRERGIIVISDEIYALTYAPAKFTSIAELYPEGTFVTSGISKFAGAGGYRLGLVIVPPLRDDQLFNFQKVGAATYTNVAGPVQYAGIAAFTLDDEMRSYLDATAHIHRIMTGELARRFAALSGVTTTEPEGSFYFVAGFNGRRAELAARGIETSSQLAASLLDHPHHVAVVSGEAVVMPPEDLSCRVAATDYDGASALAAYRAEPPLTAAEEAAFVERYGASLLRGVTRTAAWLDRSPM